MVNGVLLDPHGEEAPTGARVARPDDRLRAVSNHVARLVPLILRDDRFAVSSG